MPRKIYSNMLMHLSLMVQVIIAICTICNMGMMKFLSLDMNKNQTIFQMSIFLCSLSMDTILPSCFAETKIKEV